MQVTMMDALPNKSSPASGSDTLQRPFAYRATELDRLLVRCTRHDRRQDQRAGHTRGSRGFTLRSYYLGVPMAVEDEYTDVLQNIEGSIVAVYKDEPRLLDLDVLEALDALIRGYVLEEQGRGWPRATLSSRAALVFDACKEICEWRLGRAAMTTSRGRSVAPRPTPLGAVVQCLKRLRKSARLWNERGGRQGYVEYVQKFLPS